MGYANTGAFRLSNAPCSRSPHFYSGIATLVSLPFFLGNPKRRSLRGLAILENSLSSAIFLGASHSVILLV